MRFSFTVASSVASVVMADVTKLVIPSTVYWWMYPPFSVGGACIVLNQEAALTMG